MKTALYDFHNLLGAKIVDFAGYLLPIKYKKDIIDEHNFVRKSCGFFDVSHMGQIMLEGDGICDVFSKITPSNFLALKDGVCKYTALLNSDNGIVDDLIATKICSSKYFFVLNASRKHIDLKQIQDSLPFGVKVVNMFESHSLLAIQGPDSRDILSQFFPEVLSLGYMKIAFVDSKTYGDIIVTRTGYTGEVGFEVSVKNEFAQKFATDLFEKFSGKIEPIGLGARDSLRLEAGYPLYGNDLNETINPIEAGISFVVSKNCHRNFSKNIKRVGIKLLERGILRHDMKVFTVDGSEIGFVSSGGFSPSLQASIGMAYVPFDYNEKTLFVEIRGKHCVAEICEMPFLKIHPNL